MTLIDILIQKTSDRELDWIDKGGSYLLILGENYYIEVFPTSMTLAKDRVYRDFDSEILFKVIRSKSKAQAIYDETVELLSMKTNKARLYSIENRVVITTVNGMHAGVTIDKACISLDQGISIDDLKEVVLATFLPIVIDVIEESEERLHD